MLNFCGIRVQTCSDDVQKVPGSTKVPLISGHQWCIGKHLQGYSSIPVVKLGSSCQIRPNSFELNKDKILRRDPLFISMAKTRLEIFESDKNKNIKT